MELQSEVACPGCGRRIAIKVRDMVPGRSMNCPHCRAKISFAGDDGRKAQKALDDLGRRLK